MLFDINVKVCFIGFRSVQCSIYMQTLLSVLHRCRVRYMSAGCLTRFCTCGCNCRTGVVGRICEEVMQINSDNPTGIIIQNFYFGEVMDTDVNSGSDPTQRFEPASVPNFSVTSRIKYDAVFHSTVRW
jgi:hypothetical protein